MSRTRTNKRIGNVQYVAHKGLFWAKFEEVGHITMMIRTQCPHCEQIFGYTFNAVRILPDHQHVQICPTCKKKSVKKVGQGFTKEIRQGGQANG